MTRIRILLAALLAVSLVATAAPAAVGQQSNSGADYELSELQRGGTTHEGAPTSMRFLGSYGSATVRHEPVGLGTEDWDYVGRNTRVQTNEITLKTIRLGDPDETLTVHVVAWNRATRTVETENGTTTEPVATNVTEQVVEVELGRGYDRATVPLPASFDETQRITMWIEEYPDARWTFKHRSIATAAPIDISTWGGFLETFATKIGIIALPAMLGGAIVARRHRERALVGPQWGVLKWGAAFVLPIAVFASALAFQGAVLATRVPQLLGTLFFPFTYVLVLEGTDPNLERFLFRRQDLEDAKSPRGDDSKDSRFVDHITKTGVHRAASEELVLISPGLLPFIARLFGNLATLDVSEIQTHKKGQRSPYTLEIELDPDWHITEALVHQPPTLERQPLTRRFDIPSVGDVELPNPGVVGPLVGFGAIGWFALDATLGIPAVGGAVGALVGLPFIYRVENGGAEAEPAPFHFTQAEASLAFESERYADAKLIDQYRDVAWSERMKTPLDALKVSSEFDESQSRRLLQDELGEEYVSEIHKAADPESRESDRERPQEGVADDD